MGLGDGEFGWVCEEVRSIIVTDKYGQLMVIAQVENHWQRVGTVGEKKGENVAASIYKV